MLVDAFKVYRNDNPEAAVRCLDWSINQYCAKGNFRRAASHKESEGEVYETKLGDMARAMKAYEQAAEWYDGDNATAYVDLGVSFFPRMFGMNIFSEEGDRE